MIPKLFNKKWISLGLATAMLSLTIPSLNAEVPTPNTPRLEEPTSQLEEPDTRTYNPLRKITLEELIAQSEGKKKETLIFLHEHLELEKVEPRHIKYLNELIANNNLEFLRFAHENIRLKSIDESHIYILNELLKDKDKVELIKKHGKEVSGVLKKDYCIPWTGGFSLDEIAYLSQPENLKVLKTEANGTKNLLKKYFDLEPGSICAVKTLVDISKVKGHKEFLSYIRDVLKIKKMDPNHLSYFPTVIEKQGLKFLEYAHDVAGVEDFQALNIYMLAGILDENGLEKALTLTKKGTSKVKNIHDYLRLCLKAETLDETKVKLFNEYGITCFKLCSPKILKNILEDDMEKDTALAITSNEGIYGFTGNSIPANLVKKSLEGLTEGYQLKLYGANYEDDVYEAVKRVGEKKKISVLMIFGHGTQFSLNLGQYDYDIEILSKECLTKEIEKRYIDLTDEEELKRLTPYLAEDAIIILYSCFNGQGKEGAENMANMTKRVFRVRKICSTTTGTYGFVLEYDKNNKLVNARDFGGADYSP